MQVSFDDSDLFFFFLLCQVGVSDYIRVQDVTVHKMQYWQRLRGTVERVNRLLAAKTNRQMTDTNVFKGVSQRWLSLV